LSPAAPPAGGPKPGELAAADRVHAIVQQGAIDVHRVAAAAHGNGFGIGAGETETGR
jgi:hypothetical protein